MSNLTIIDTGKKIEIFSPGMAENEYIHKKVVRGQTYFLGYVSVRYMNRRVFSSVRRFSLVKRVTPDSIVYDGCKRRTKRYNKAICKLNNNTLP